MDDSSILICEHRSKGLVNSIQKVIDEKFTLPDHDYVNWPTHKFRALAREVQDDLSENQVVESIVRELGQALYEYLDTPKFLAQSNLYLRCSRPALPFDQESIGFHRESFYGSNMEKSVNIWTPIRGVDKSNTLRYVPASQSIPSDQLEIESEDDNYTDQFSDGHRLGFQYRPKKIIGGIDLDSCKPMIVDKYSSALFSGELIHGSAINRSKTIRFSVDFRVIRESDYSTTNKQFHYSSGKPYFVDVSL